MRGKLYGIGVGPGDPELLTIKAVNTIRKCGVIAAPEPEGSEMTALQIVQEYLDGKELLECRFIMSHDIAKRKESRRNVAASISKMLEQGKDVGFITLGDPTTYSTFMYIHEIIVSEGFEAEIVPGITSYAAAAAALGIALCEGNEALTLIPASHGGDADELLSRPGNKVIMKAGANLSNVLQKLKARGYGDRTRIVSRASMDGQRLYFSIEDYEKTPEQGYFTLTIVKEKS